MPDPRLTRRTMLAAGAAAAAAPVLAPLPAVARPRESYRWRNVTIGGGGGFVPGIVFNQSEPDLIYARTDIGGAYRWDPATRTWLPLLDWVGWDRWGYTGVASLATDPVDPDRVYAAVGTYTNDWDPNRGAILRSRDRGERWQVSELPFKLGGNMPGRGIGERLAIDPHRNRTLYLAAPSGHGLWRSLNHGVTWHRVNRFPNPGNFVPDPSDPTGYNSANLGVLWVTFDPRTGRPHRPTGTIYVGVADPQNMLYRSTDAGLTWHRVPGQPTGFIPHKGVLDPTGGFLYLATSNQAGPFDGESGDVWRLDTATDQWTRISPVPSTSPDNFFGYSGLTVDRQRPGTLMVATQISWWPDVVIFRSTDGGASWTRSWDFGPVWPDRINRYDLDISAAPYLTWNATPAPPEQSPKLGWMTESVEIDPFSSDRLLYGTGATIYGTENLSAWDTGGTVHIAVHAVGVEETSVLDLVSPPAGAHLVSAVRDVGGFVHHDFAQPSRMPDSPTFSNTTSLDYAALAPAVLVRAGNEAPYLGTSTDGGDTWAPAASQPAGTSGGGTVAVSADGGTLLWSPAGAAPHRSVDAGATWTAATGLPAGARVAADRADPATFYGYASGAFYASVDGGASFAPTGATDLPAQGNVRFRAVPDLPGEVWLAGGDEAGGVYGLWHSTDRGTTFTRLAGVEQADAIGFGKAAPGQAYPALFTTARIGGIRGIFRSDDAGSSWVRVNDDDHQYAWTGETITGDPRVYGRVYLATNGRGIVYGDPT